MKLITATARGVACGVLLLLLCGTDSVWAQPSPGDPKPDVSIVGPTRDPDDIRDEGLKQQNEPACAVRPGDSDCVICFFNDYRTVDIIGHEDAWIASAMSCDAANTWESRVVPNHPTHPAPVGFPFAADPRVVAIPGMAIHGFIVGERASDEGKVLVQHWLENNKDDADFYEPSLNSSTVDTGFQDFFLDKPDMLAVIHPQTVRNRSGDDDDDCDDDDDDDDGGSCFTTIDTITLSTQMENTDLGTITRTYPTGTLYMAYTAFFSSTRSQLLVKKSTDWGVTWSTTATALTDGNTLVSGLTLTELNGKIMAMWRQVGEGTDPDAMYYATTSVTSSSWSTPQKLADVCSFDQPSATFINQVTFRTNAFPWLANDGKNFYAFYTSRLGQSPNSCSDGVPKIVVSYSSDAVNWSAPQPVADTPGAQFMPTAFGARGKVQFAWYDTSREMIDITGSQPFIADFIPATGTIVNRKVDVYTARITADAPGGPIQVSEPVRVSKFRAAADPSDPFGPLYEIEASFANAKMFKSGELSFLGDYFAVAAPEFRPDGAGGWESNASAVPSPGSNLVDFFIAYADNRDVRGDVLFDNTGINSPYTPTDNLPAPGGAASIAPGESVSSEIDPPADVDADGATANAEGIEDVFTDPSIGCEVGSDRTRDSNIYGSIIRDVLRLSSPVESRPLSGILRAVPVLVNNVTDAPARYRLYIANQPGSDPVRNRASFRQKPDRAPFTSVNYPGLDLSPVLTEDFEIPPRSSIARTVFLVSTDISATVDVQIFDGGCADEADFINPTNPVAFASACPVLASINIGGTSNAGALQQPDYLSSVCGTDTACANVQVTELHNPLIENPLIENQTPEAVVIKNPLIENPLIENPLIENPLIENPLIENYGFQNPLIENPLIENPLIENPLIENPLIENPLIENPLIENTALAANDITFDEYTAVVRNDGNVTTAYNFDATAAGFTSTGGGAPASQLILWKQYAYGTSRDCFYVPEGRNQVVATVNSFDDTLSVASIDNPFAGEASMILAPGEQGFATVRLWGTTTELANAGLSKFTVSSQAANCDEFDDTFGPPAGQEDDFYTCQDTIANDRELVVLDLDTTGPTFTNLNDGDIIPAPPIQADAPGGACISPVGTLVNAQDDGSGLAGIACFNQEGAAICGTTFVDGVTVSIPVSNLDGQPLQYAPMTCVAVDVAGNSTSVNLLVDVRDTTPPEFATFPADPTNEEAGQFSGTATITFETGVTAVDVNNVDPNPDITCETSTGLTSGPIPAGTYEATCTATDASGNSTETPPFQVNVVDVTPPVITLVGPTLLFFEAGPAYSDPGATADDNVDGPVSVTIDASAVDTSVPDDYTVIYTASDAAGKTSTTTRTVRVQDTTAPNLDLPDNFAVNASETDPNALVDFLATATDNAAGNVTVTCDPPPGSIFPIGITIVECTATDAAGNASSVSTFEVEVVDVTPPVITVPGPTVVSASDTTPDAVVNFTVAASDNSGTVSSLSCVPPTGSTFLLGTTTVKCTATDPAGRTAMEEFDVTVEDTTPPEVSIGIDNPLQLQAGDPLPDPQLVVTDNVGVVGQVMMTGFIDTSRPGTYTLTYTAKDAANNPGSATLTVDVIDTTPPVLNLPAPISAFASASGDATVIFDVTATDNAFGTPTVNCDLSSPATLGIGVRTVSCTATDVNGNTSAPGTFTITVVDNLPPILALPGPIVVPAASDAPNAVVNYTVTATDNSGNPPTITCGPAPGLFPVGTTPVSCTASDGAGNTASGSFTVTVNDETPPVVTLLGDNPLEVVAGTDFTDPGATATDNVGVEGGITVTGMVNTAVPGSYTLTYSARDRAGKVGSATRQVNVVDKTPPVIDVPLGGLTATLTSAAGAHVDYSNDVSIRDDIDPAPSLNCSPVSGSLFPPGTKTVTCNGTDSSGNTATAEFDVTVNYGGSNGINAKKRRAKSGSSIPLSWSWQNSSGQNVDSSGDTQFLRITDCGKPSMVVLDVAGDPGTSGFRIKGFVWEFNWQSNWNGFNGTFDKLPKGKYCAEVESSVTGQKMTSPPITLR